MNLKKNTLILGLSLLLVGCVLCSVDPYEAGEYQVNSTTILRIEALQLEYNLRVYAPNEPGTFKVIYFLSGFDGREHIHCH